LRTTMQERLDIPTRCARDELILRVMVYAWPDVRSRETL
jgi:hypothetical protein